MSAVTSRGCSRAFILCTLYRALYSVSLQFYDGIPVSHPFNNNDIDKWLTLAKEDCADQEFQDLLGGITFLPSIFMCTC